MHVGDCSWEACIRDSTGYVMAMMKPRWSNQPRTDAFFKWPASLFHGDSEPLVGSEHSIDDDRISRSVSRGARLGQCLAQHPCGSLVRRCDAHFDTRWRRRAPRLGRHGRCQDRQHTGSGIGIALRAAKGWNRGDQQSDRRAVADKASQRLPLGGLPRGRLANFLALITRSSRFTSA